jgi:hypothetical protein
MRHATSWLVGTVSLACSCTGFRGVGRFSLRRTAHYTKRLPISLDLSLLALYPVYLMECIQTHMPG